MTPLIVLTCLLMAQDGPARPAPVPSPIDLVASIESVMADAIARAEASVVAIHRDKGPNPHETLAVRGRRPPGFFGDPNRMDGQLPIPLEELVLSFDYGSGVVIGDDGEILTAFHVVRGARRLVVSAMGGPPFLAEVIAADPRSDMAVIAPASPRGAERPHLKPLPIGDASRLRKGSFLIALGNPFNAARKDGSPSASWGILSNVARRLEPDQEQLTLTRTTGTKLQNFPTLLQLDAKLNLGMSGGAVINLRGELVGLTTTAASPAGFDSQAGYAIPMDRIGRRIVETLRQGKEVEYGLLGIRSDPIKSNRVMAVTRNSPADQGLILAGDEIIAVNNAPIEDFDSLILAINAFPAGDSVRLKIRRADEILERTIVLAKYPVEGEVIATNRPKAWRGLRVDYTTQLNFPAFGPGLMDMTAAGVVVTDVEDGSPAAAAGVKKGVLILRIGDQPVRTPREFAEAAARLQGPVSLETDLGVLTVGTGGSSRPKPPVAVEPKP